MKILSGTVLSTLTLCVALISIASAQPAVEFQQEDQQNGALGPSTIAKPPVLPVAEAKKRYLEKQKYLEEVANGRWTRSVELPVEHLEARLVTVKVQDPRDRIRTAVAEAFDARRQLQQAELAELENRIVRIKRALEIRDAMRDTVIDQRTDELLDQIEENGKNGQREGMGLKYPGTPDGAVVPPSKSGSVKTSAVEIKKAQIDVTDAEANLASAKQHYDYAKKMHAKGFVTELDVNNKAAEYKRAKLELEYSQEKLTSLGGTPLAQSPVAEGTPAESEARAEQRNARLLQLDVDEAQAAVEAAEKAYKRAKAQNAAGALEPALVEDQHGKYNLAQIQLERALLKLEAPTRAVAAEASRNQRLARLDVQEAETNLAVAKFKYERFKRLYDDKAIDESFLDEQTETYKRAQIQLERAMTKLKAFDRAPTGDDAATDPKKTSTDQTAVDESQIVWGPRDYQGPGEPIAAIQLGHLVEPIKTAYAPREALTVKLFLKHTGKQADTFKAPRNEILERFGINLVLRDANGEELDWRWGPAHKDPDDRTRSGHDLLTLAPGQIYQFPSMQLMLGRRKMVGRGNFEPTIFAYLDVKPGQVARFSIKFTQDPAGAGTLKLETAPFEFRIEEPAAKK